MKSLFYFRNALFLLLLIFSACKSTSRVSDPASKNEGESEGEEIDREAIYWARVDSAKMEFTQADVDFMTGMIAHHAQALIMSRLAPTHGANPKVQRLCARIINSQKDEIASMQQWLRERDQPVPKVQIDGLNLTISGGGMQEHHHSGHEMSMKMPGMLTQTQLEELDEARGSAFDRLFLKYMIQHHSGALTMVEDLFNADGAALEDAAFKLASEINVDQKTEIARMKLVLNNLTSASKKP